ncbi:DUF4345 family protein [Boseongicola aestuarii]|jgi:hypothetical protein|uniref:DUF4345 domain-containing protein n=1 Tax=Boseongicola aestuarii TaxID=1470561 RepID=A0A238J3E6_9RHOB|nr:DUF4345 family protein [Boseongicola aestuarii]SMX24434.1 hypothetical protein BOA8489_02559 [Boseongicola aestuarii]
MTDIINILLALASVGLGAVGWLMPRYTMDLLDMAPTNSTMGLSEIRAASGALFIGLGLGAIILNTPLAFAMVGFAWGGAAIGRLTSIVADGDASRMKITFFAIEAAVASTLLAINL